MQQDVQAATRLESGIFSVSQTIRQLARWPLLLAFVIVAPGLHAQDGSGGIEPSQEFGKHLRAAQKVTPFKANRETFLENCGTKIKFSSLKAIPLDYLGWLSQPISASSSLGAAIFWPFDIESRPVEGEWMGVGIVLASSGDVGSESLGGIIWIQKSSQSEIRYKNNAVGRASISFWTELNGHICDEFLNFEIKSNQAISFGERSIGKIIP